MDLKNQKGVVFIAVLIYTALSIFLIGGYVTMASREYKITKETNDNIKAFYDAEAGANRGLAEIKKRVQTDITTNMRAISLGNRSNISTYYDSSDSLGFLAAYAYEGAASQFTVSGTAPNQIATLAIPGVTGFNYSGTITIKKNGNPSYDSNQDVYTFPYKYDTIYGEAATDTATKKVTFSGIFEVQVFPQSFATYALFTNKQETPGGKNVYFANVTSFYGPVHTNDRFNFYGQPLGNPAGIFTDLVTQFKKQARFWNNGSPVTIDADSNPPHDVPTFQAGFTRDVAKISMPTTVDKDTQRRRALGLADSDAIPNYADGIYVPNSAGEVTGGIYVENDATITTGVSGDNATYSIIQGATTQNITVDYINNQTTVHTVGVGTDTYTGTLNGMIFVNDGNITSLSGTIQKDSQVTIAATDDVIFTEHMQYEDFTPGTPPSAEGAANTLGVMSWDRDVRIDTGCPDDLNIHATVMAPKGVFKVDNHDSGSFRGPCTVLGGVITDKYGAFGTTGGTGYGRNFVYDNRMSQGTCPPFFPVLPNFDASEDGLNNNPGWREE